VALAVAIWFSPVPEGLTAPAWHLFAIFAATIIAVVADVIPILTASVIAVSLAVLTGTLSPAKAYSGFANGTILLIVLAFLVARAVVTCGLGQRIGYAVVSLFGRSTLGLSYSVFLVDGVIAPAFPSNTARAGVLFPLAFSLAEAAGARPDDPSRRRLGGFLMYSGIASLSVSSALWLTAMAANPLGAEIARPFGVEIGFGSWLLASSVPTVTAILLLPLLLYKLMSPEVTRTPEAPAAAKKALAELGPLSLQEKLVMATFVGMVALWGASATLGLDSTAVAFLGLGLLLLSGTLTLDDIAKQGDVLAIYLWFAVLFTLSSQLNELGFMGFLGQNLASALGGMPPIATGLILVVAYVLLHYLFVSQTAHLLALFGVFLDVGVRLGVPATILAFLLLFATNFFSGITPQGSSANLLFAGSGFMTQGELYRIGAISTAFSLLVYLVIGVPWLMLVAR
jgi:divalent anion:Na+ symporter, DASS family